MTRIRKIVVSTFSTNWRKLILQGCDAINKTALLSLLAPLSILQSSSQPKNTTGGLGFRSSGDEQSWHGGHGNVPSFRYNVPSCMVLAKNERESLPENVQGVPSIFDTNFKNSLVFRSLN